MPKKFKGENSKAVEAKVRKDAARVAEQEKKKQEEEDAFWQDDDKHVARKQQRKEEKEKKRLEQLERKKELQKMVEEEMSSLKSAKPAAAAKMTRAQVQANMDKLEAEAAAAAKKADVPHDEQPLEENLNRLELEGEEARNVEEAISVLGKGEPEADRHPEKRVKAAYIEFKGEPEADRHPEKRVKAAYIEYEELHLPRLKAENPNMRLSQLKQMLKKDWMKSPDNPLNQRMASFNQKR